MDEMVYYNATSNPSDLEIMYELSPNGGYPVKRNLSKEESCLMLGNAYNGTICDI
jgi:hypothetical protein